MVESLLLLEPEAKGLSASIMTDSDSEGEPGPEEAGELVFSLLNDLKVRAKISATDACILPYWIVLVGATNKSLGKLAKEPDDKTLGATVIISIELQACILVMTILLL